METETNNVDSNETAKETETQESIEDRIAKLEARTEKAEALAREKDQGFRTLQRKYSELQKQQTESTASSINKKLVEELERRGDPDDPSTNARIQTLKAEIARIEQQETYNSQIRQQQAIAEDKRDELESQIRQAGLDPNDEQFDGVWDAWELSSLADGKFERAENKLTRILKKVTPKEEKTETEEKLRERIIREYLEKQGSLKQEKPRPSGSGRTFTQQEIDAMSPKEFRENYEEIKVAQEEGRIK